MIQSPARPLILLVDDNEANLELLQAYLEGVGGSIMTARDGLEALRCLEAHKPDLILLDVMMPRMSGYQLCKRLKADPATKGIPVVMVTALTEVSDQERAEEVGADDFISKPITKPDLLARIARHLAKR
ncbi:MAG: response regulator [Phycisphaeraceae bacterium]|nr:response regulator [Phycisphaeraceae bacterium]